MDCDGTANLKANLNKVPGCNRSNDMSFFIQFHDRSKIGRLEQSNQNSDLSTTS